jgi:hypothetical protein
LRIKLINGNPWALRAPSYGDTFYREVLVAQNCQTVARPSQRRVRSPRPRTSPLDFHLANAGRWPLHRDRLNPSNRKVDQNW